jgi:hypothetical protein
MMRPLSSRLRLQGEALPDVAAAVTVRRAIFAGGEAARRALAALIAVRTIPVLLALVAPAAGRDTVALALVPGAVLLREDEAYPREIRVDTCEE